MSEQLKRNKALIIIIFISLILQLYTINRSSLWMDETTSVIDAKEPVKKILFDPNWKDQVPLYRLILHFWIIVFGETEFALRLFSVLFGVISVLMLYQLTKVMLSRKVALLASFFLSINTLFIKHAQEAGKYTLFIVLSLLTVYFVFQVLKREEKKRKVWLLFIITSLLNMYTHIFASFILLAEIIYLILFLKKKEIDKLIVSLIIILVLYLPIIIGIVISVSFRSQYHPDLGIASSFLSYIKEIIISFSGNVGLTIIFSILIINALIWSFKTEKKLFWLFTLLNIIPILCVYALKNIIMDIQVRHFIFLLPIYLLFAAYGVVCIQKKLFSFLTLSLVIVISIPSLNNYYNRSTLQWDIAVNFIKDNFQDEDIIVASWWTENIVKYYSDLPYIKLEDIKRISDVKYKRIWLAYRENYPTSEEIKSFISMSKCEIKTMKSFGMIKVYLLLQS